MRRPELLLLVGLLGAPPALAAPGADYQALARQGQLVPAEAAARAHLTGHPGDLEARAWLARILAWRKDYPAALREYRSLLARAPRNVDYLLGATQVLLWQGQPGEARKLAERGLSMAPRYEELHRARIQALTLLGLRDETARAIAEAAARVPGAHWPAAPAAPLATLSASVAPATASLAQATRLERSGQYGEAETLLRRRLDERPDDVDARYRLAKLLAWQNRHQEAIAEYRRVLALAPRQPDYLLGAATVLTWAGQGADAVALLELARHLAPDYRDVWTLELRVLEGAGQWDRARALRLAAARRFPEADWGLSRDPLATWQGATASVALPLEAETFVQLDALTAGHKPWIATGLTLSQPLGGGSRLEARLQQTTRFGLGDLELGLGGTWVPAAGWTLALAGSTSPTGAVLPRYGMTLGAGWTFAPTWGLTLAGGRTGYASGGHFRQSLELEKYLGSWRVALQGLLAEIDGMSTVPGAALAATWSPWDQTTLSLQAGRGTEQELVAGSGLLTSQVTTLRLAAQHAPDGPWHARAELEWQQVGSSYDRLGVRLGLGRSL